MAYISSITLPNNDTLLIKDSEALRNIGVLGDLVYWSNTNTPSHLAIGTDGQVLKSNGGTPQWEDEYKIEILDLTGVT